MYYLFITLHDGLLLKIYYCLKHIGTLKHMNPQAPTP
jgi:hypothetical protein